MIATAPAVAYLRFVRPMVGDSAKIYMPLLNEGTECWRPVTATPLKGDTYCIDEQRYDREDEEWQFPPGSIVRCRHQDLSGDRCLVAYESTTI